MKKILFLTLVMAFGFFVSACQEKTTDEKLKETSEKEAELIKKSISEKADKVGNAIEKGLDELKK